MSPKAARSVLALMTALAVASCGDRAMLTAPAALDLAASASETVVPCDVSWTNAAGGTWSTATNWSTGTVPTASQNVCITMNGPYTVNVYGAVTAKSITIGAPDNTGVVTVNVQVG